MVDYMDRIDDRVIEFQGDVGDVFQSLIEQLNGVNPVNHVINNFREEATDLINEHLQRIDPQITTILEAVYQYRIFNALVLINVNDFNCKYLIFQQIIFAVLSKT